MKISFDHCYVNSVNGTLMSLSHLFSFTDPIIDTGADTQCKRTFRFKGINIVACDVTFRSPIRQFSGGFSHVIVILLERRNLYCYGVTAHRRQIAVPQKILENLRRVGSLKNKQ